MQRIHKHNAISIYQLLEKVEPELQQEFNLNGFRGVIEKFFSFIKEELLKGNHVYIPGLGTMLVAQKNVYVPSHFSPTSKVVPTWYIKFNTENSLKEELAQKFSEKQGG